MFVNNYYVLIFIISPQLGFVITHPCNVYIFFLSLSSVATLDKNDKIMISVARSLCVFLRNTQVPRTYSHITQNLHTLLLQ